MDRLRHFLYLNYLNFKLPFYYCGITSVLLVLFMNFCFTEYNDLNQKRETLEALDYTNIFEVSFSAPEENQYEPFKNELTDALGKSAIILNYRRNPLYTTIKHNRVISIHVITAEEAEYFHLFCQVNPDEDTYSVIVSDNLQNIFKPNSEYTLPIGMYVHEDTWKIHIKVIDKANHLMLLSPHYNSIQSPQDTLLIFDPKNTLPLHLAPAQKPVFSLYMYIQDYEKSMEILKNYPFIHIQKMQDKIEYLYRFNLQLLPSYFKFLLLGSFTYIILSVNFYLLFYYKQKKYIVIFNYCNLTRKFYLQCIGILTILQLCFGLIVGQLLWYLYCIYSETTYWHNERIFLPFLLLIHACIFILLNRGYNYLARTYH